MTIERKKKQAVREFMAEHSLSYREALRLMGLEEKETVLRDSQGTEYLLWIESDQLEIYWETPEGSKAFCAGVVMVWAAGHYPGDPQWKIAKPVFDPDGGKRAQGGDRLPSGELPYLSAEVVELVRSYILKTMPNWDSHSKSHLDNRRQQSSEHMEALFPLPESRLSSTPAHGA